VTDRIRTLTVLLTHDVRTDDAEAIRAALRMVRGVADVIDGDAVGGDEHLRREAALSGFTSDLHEFIRAMSSPFSREDGEALRAALAEIRRRRGVRS
jgi:hypothetical protein